MYYAIISGGERGGLELLRSDNYGYAKSACDNYKRDTGINCHIESRHRCYTTSTLEEALVEDMVNLTNAQLASRGQWDGSTAHARVINASKAAAAGIDAATVHAAAKAGTLEPKPSPKLPPIDFARAVDDLTKFAEPGPR
jgi:hypothetical protein